MKIAYLVHCHTDPAFVRRVAEKLATGENHVFIHVDAKQALEPFLFKAAQVHFIENRRKNNWGGWSAVEATIQTLREALAFADFDRYVFLQGQDYPLYSNETIDAFFEKHREVEFCNAYNLTRTTNRVDAMHAYGHWFYEYPVNRALWVCGRLYGKALKTINALKIKYRRGYILEGGERIELYSGWAQWAFTGACAAYILNFYDTHPKVNRYFRTVFPPDEIYFQTVVYNSPFAEKTANGGPFTKERQDCDLMNLTYFEYPVYVTVFTEPEDYAMLAKTGYLYVRKVNSSSRRLLDYIDENAE